MVFKITRWFLLFFKDYLSFDARLKDYRIMREIYLTRLFVMIVGFSKKTCHKTMSEEVKVKNDCEKPKITSLMN